MNGKINRGAPAGHKKKIGLVFLVVLWVLAGWLLYPLLILDSIGIENAKEFLYRSTLGITIMLILFGKTLIDLLLPQVSSKRIPLLNTVFLTIYSFALAGGIIFMIVRMIVLYVMSRNTGIIF